MEDTFCKAEKEKVAKELQESYNTMLSRGDLLQFEVGYHLGYSKAKEKDRE